MRNSIIALTVASAVAASSAASAAPPAGLPSRVPPFPFVKLLSALRSMGDPHPSSAVWVASHHSTAVSVTMGDSVPGNQPVYVAVVRGNFTAFAASPPFGAKAPKGTVAVVIYNARTGQSTDFGLSNRVPNLRRLGVIHDFLPYLKQATEGTKIGPKPMPSNVPASIETQWLERLSAGSRLGCQTHFPNLPRASFLARLSRAAATGGFGVRSIQFLHACQAAPIVRLSTSSPRRLVAELPALERRLDRIALGGRTVWAFEGIFIEVETERGQPLVVIWNHVRAELAGGQWAASPDLYPFPHG